ncbi:actin-related protein 2-like isoform X2 [Oculina patagonica]
MDSEGRKIIVCDTGTDSIKCGFSGTNIPEHIIPSVVGKRFGGSKPEVHAIKELMVGDEAKKHCRENVELSYPVNDGIVQNWDDMMHLWDYTFGVTKLNIEPRTCNIFLSEPPMYPMSKRERIIEIMFENYQFDGVYIAIQAVLAMYARGLLTGVVIDCGHGSSHISPVRDGFLVPDLTRRFEIGGRDITNYLKELLLLRGHIVDFEKARLIKEKLCYVGYNIEEEKKLASETTVLMEEYTLPDGQVVKMECERFGAPEALFQPNLIGVDKVGVAEMLFDTLQAADIETRADYYKQIVLCGGTTMLPGFPNRIEREIKQLYCERVFKGDTSRLSKFTVRVEDPPNRQHSVFLGGSVMADIMKDKRGFWMTRQEYEEKGIYVLEKLGVKVRGEKEYFDETDTGHLDDVDGKSITREKVLCEDEYRSSTRKRLLSNLRRLIPVLPDVLMEGLVSDVSCEEGIQPLNEKMKNLDLGGPPANESEAIASLVHEQSNTKAEAVNKTETGLEPTSPPVPDA